MTTMEKIDGYATLEAGALVLQRWLPGPAERVWRYLTDSDLRAKWFAAGDMPMQVGGALELVWRNRDLSRADDPWPEGSAEVQRMATTMLAVEPGRMLRFGWGAGHVTFELMEKGDRVLLTITHTGIDDAEKRLSIATGWHTHVAILAAKLEGTQPPSLYEGCRELRPVYAARFA